MHDVHVRLFGWDTATLRRRLMRDLHALVTAMRSQSLAAIAKEAEVRVLAAHYISWQPTAGIKNQKHHSMLSASDKRICSATGNLVQAIMNPCRVLLKEGTSETLRKLLLQNTQKAKKNLLKVVRGYKLERNEAEQMMAAMAAAGRECIRQCAREAANDALISMEWRDLDEAARARAVDGFGRQASAMVEHCLEYDVEAAHLDEGVRSNKRELLLKGIGKLVQPAYTATVAHHRTAALGAFREALDRELATENDVPFAKAANAAMRAAVEGFDAMMDDARISLLGWGTAEPRKELSCDLDAHLTAVRSQRLAAIAKEAEANLVQAVRDPCRVLLKEGSSRTWPMLRKLLLRNTQEAKGTLLKVVRGYELERREAAEMVAALAAAGRECIQQCAREAADDALTSMLLGFHTVFYTDTNSLPRVWNCNADILASARDAHATVGCLDLVYGTLSRSEGSAMHLLAVVAAVQLNEEQPDMMEAVLLSWFPPNSTFASAKPLSSLSWDQVRWQRLSCLLSLHCPSITA
eukprot:SM000236S08016  [mRNA]  locus=s236:154422:160981:- [translate_table: standard]